METNQFPGVYKRETRCGGQKPGCQIFAPAGQLGGRCSLTEPVLYMPESCFHLKRQAQLAFNG